ncbi:MAG: 16S rRNA (guanine(527)-N(7))-methyltransferase RsmG [Lachnospiraceae bacterium]|nr:16S rRNA (guanine(527)-N(7))-methyltransferase RsmG [Lachnospiraceae bacterium]
MDKDTLQSLFESLGVSLNAGQLNRFLLYNELLLDWNSRMNLTAITEPQEVMVKHFADSCAPLFCWELGFNRKARLIDVGTGAGFPGLPLKIACPELDITLLDSLNKRVGFLNEVIARLGLSGIRAVHSRAEDAARDKLLRESFDYAVSRAVANMSTLSEYCLPFVKTGGTFLAWKSGEFLDDGPASEAAGCRNALKLLGGSEPEVFRYELGNSGLTRCIAAISKIHSTPAKYPRKAGTAAKQPL